MKFRRRETVVEAERWDFDLEHPGVVFDMFGAPYVVDVHGHKAHLSEGDWVIKEPGGQGYFRCTPTTFERLYDPVTVTAPMPGNRFSYAPGSREFTVRDGEDGRQFEEREDGYFIYDARLGQADGRDIAFVRSADMADKIVAALNGMGD